MFSAKWRKADRASKAQQLQLLEQQQQQQPPIPKQDYFESDCHRTYSCIHCRAHLANHDELISKLFQGNHGRAYLFNKVVNIGCKQAVERELLTGLHAVADIYCDSCETTLGWKYEQAFVPSQKYKEGKYIIELVHMLKENNWDLTSHNTRELLSEQDDKVFARNQQQQQKKNNRWFYLRALDDYNTNIDGENILDNSSSSGNNCCYRSENGSLAQIEASNLLTKTDNCAVRSRLGKTNNNNVINDSDAITLADNANLALTSIPSSSSSSPTRKTNNALCNQIDSGHDRIISLQNNKNNNNNDNDTNIVREIQIDMAQDSGNSELPNELPSLEYD